MLVLAVLLLCAAPSLQDQCSRTARVSVTSSRNQTGHWLTRVLWGHETGGAEVDHKETTPVTFDMIQQVRGCSGIETLSVEATLRTPPLPAAPGYALLPGLGRYKFHATAVTWEAARQTCSGEGAHLAVVRSKKQEDALKTLFARHPKIDKTTWDQVVWLGFHDQHSEGDFITVLGEPFSDVGYANWAAGKPNNHVYDGFKGDSDCGTLGRDGVLYDLPCDAKYAFICEQELW